MLVARWVASHALWNIFQALNGDAIWRYHNLVANVNKCNKQQGRDMIGHRIPEEKHYPPT